MKTLNEISKEIEDLTNKGIELNGVTKQKNRIRKRLAVLFKCKIYLESSPTVDSIKNQLNETKRRIKITEEGYWVWIKENATKGYKNPKTKYATEMGLKGLKQQFSNLKYLIS